MRLRSALIVRVGVGGALLVAAVALGAIPLLAGRSTAPARVDHDPDRRDGP